MTMSIGGSIALKFPDDTTTAPSEVNSIFTSTISSISNTTIIRNSVDFSGSNGISIGTLNYNTAFFTVTISSTQTNLDLRAFAVSSGWNQTRPLLVRINKDVVIRSNAQATPALTISGSFPGGLRIINEGIIVGKGGNGMYFQAGYGGSPLQAVAGGVAISASSNVSIENYGIIGGGGGGGGGTNELGEPYGTIGGNGGAGFGADGWNWWYSAYGVSYWEYGFDLTTNTGNKTAFATDTSIGGGNTWKDTFPGRDSSLVRWPRTGLGGQLGQSGSAADDVYYSGGGLWSSSAASYPGAAAGPCTSGNSFITWIVPGSRYGALA